MKRSILTTAALVLLAGALVMTDAVAAGRGKREKQGPRRTEMPEEYMQAHHFDRDPSMSFHSGTLRRDGLAGWRVGEVALQLTADATVMGPDGQESFLQEGREAVVMGPRFGSTMLAWSVRMLGSQPLAAVSASNAGRKPSDSDSDVGELVNAPN